MLQDESRRQTPLLNRVLWADVAFEAVAGACRGDAARDRR
jgi:hypothetical protein